jgi:diguanylate cyclase (GGDEF)-like protein
LQKRELELAKQHSDHSANHDLLTGLPNRRAFHDKLKACIDFGLIASEAAGLLFIDLDKFKDVNDALGHEAGDNLLRQVAERLRAIAGDCGFVARIGGDEFAFILSGGRSGITTQCHLVAERILEALRFAVATAAGPIHVGCTIGIATCPMDATDPRELTNIADRMMYVGKKAGRNRIISTSETAGPGPARLTSWSLLR